MRILSSQNWLKCSVLALSATVLAACGDGISYAQKESPANAFKDYRADTAAVIGVGQPMTGARSKEGATVDLKGRRSLNDAMKKVAHNYNLAVRWGDGVRKNMRKDVLVAGLTFDEIRNYIEDTYDVQIIREGDRRILVLPSLKESRIEEFAPGMNVTLSQVVRGLAEECDYNLVITENKGKLSSTLVTTSLSDMTCRDAFDAVLVPHGLTLIQNGDHYTVGGFPSRQWTLNLHEPVVTTKQAISYSTSSQGSGESGEAMSGGSSSLDVSEERDLWKDLTEDLNVLLEQSCKDFQAMSAESSLPAPGVDGGESFSPVTTLSSGEAAGEGDCGYVRVNRTVGMVQMQAPYSILEQADETISRIEDIASRRLFVQARILAVSRERSYDQGGNFAAGREVRDGEYGIGHNPTSSITTAITDILRLDSNTAGGFLGYDGNTIEAAVRVAESFGTTYQIMNPSMEVMDRQRGIMVDGRVDKYFIVNKTETTTDGVTNAEFDTEEKEQFVGVQFSVIAQIAEDGDAHTVSIQVPITDIVDEKIIPQSEGSTVPIVTTRIIDQKVKIRDGEVKVIGGLNRTIAIDRESGIPLIRGVPVAGKLFNEEGVEFQDVEFIVLLSVRRVY